MSSTPSTTTRSATFSTRDDIQGLRAIAVLAVVIFHTGLPLRGGFAGVDVFFTISGFVITSMLLREEARTGSISLKRFYQRRFKRLTPALAVVLICTLLGSALFLTPFGQQQIATKTALGALFFVANAAIAKGTGGYFDPAASTNPLLHTWSLSVEEQFYLVYPIALILTIKFFRRALTGLLVAASLGSLFLAVGASTIWPYGFYSPLTRAWEFGLGALVATSGLTLSRRAASASSWCGLGMLALSGVLVSSSERWPGAFTILPTLATAMCIAGGVNRTEEPVANRILSSRPLKTIGDYSYSIYLWHWPFICLVSAVNDSLLAKVCAAFVSVLPAKVSYRFLETPFRKRELSGTRQWVPALAASFLVPACVAGSVTVAVHHNWWNSQILAVNSKIGTHLGWNDCLRLDTGGTGTRQINMKSCTFGNGKTHGSIYLIGDSNAAMYSDPAYEVAKTSGRQLIVRTAAGCSMADIYRSSGGTMGPSDQLCRKFVSETLEELSHAPRGSVVYIAESPTQWLLAGRGESLTNSHFSTSFEGRSNVMREGLSKTITTLKRDGLRPVLVEPIVTFTPSAPVNTAVMCRTTISLFLNQCPQTVPIKDADPHDRSLQRDVQSLAREDAVPFISITTRQCPNGACPPSVKGAPVLMDAGEHFSAAFATQLAPDFARAVSVQ